MFSTKAGRSSYRRWKARHSRMTRSAPEPLSDAALESAILRLAGMGYAGHIIRETRPA